MLGFFSISVLVTTWVLMLILAIIVYNHRVKRGTSVSYTEMYDEIYKDLRTELMQTLPTNKDVQRQINAQKETIQKLVNAVVNFREMYAHVIDMNGKHVEHLERIMADQFGTELWREIQEREQAKLMQQRAELKERQLDEERKAEAHDSRIKALNSAIYDAMTGGPVAHYDEETNTWLTETRIRSGF